MAVALRRAAIIAAALFALLGGSCDRTQLRGRIVASPPEGRVGEPVELELEIPPELDRIYWVTWSVDPDAEIEFDRVFDRETQPSYAKSDRRAVFTARQPGEYRVRTTGIYRQTNYQTIAEIKVTVRRDEP